MIRNGVEEENEKQTMASGGHQKVEKKKKN